MATKASKKLGSLVAKNKDFMANFSYDRMNPPVPARTGSLAARPAVPTTAQPSQMSNTDVVDTFNGLKQQATPQGYKRPILRRGMSGAELDANGNDSGSGMNWFDKNNSPAQVDARNARQGVLDQRRGAQMAAAGASAVAERKALQEMGQAPFQLQEANRAANSVKGNDGYMTLFDGKGNAVGTNRPPAQPKNWAAENAAYGGGDLSSTNPKNPNLQAQIQQGFNQDAQQPRPMGPPKPASNFLDSYATPGGSNASVVGAPSAPGTPVGGNVSQKPSVIKPVDYFGSIDTSQAPNPQANTDWNLIAQRGMTYDADKMAQVGPPVTPPEPPPLKRLTPDPYGLNMGNPGAVKDNPYGVNEFDIPRLMGAGPVAGQILDAGGAYLNDLWSSLKGQPQNAWEQFLRQQNQAARKQYQSGVR